MNTVTVNGVVFKEPITLEYLIARFGKNCRITIDQEAVPDEEVGGFRKFVAGRKSITVSKGAVGRRA